MTNETSDTIEIYQDAGDEWRWRYKAAGNSATMADGGEGYKNKTSAYQGALRVCGIEQTAGSDSLLASANAAEDGKIDDVLFRGDEMINVKFLATD